MAGRIIASLILTLGFCFPQVTWGQGQWNGPVPAYYETGNWYDPTAVQPAGHVALNPALPGYPVAPHAPTVQAVAPIDYAPAGQMQYDAPYYSPEGIVSERVSKPSLWNSERPLEKFLANMVTNTYVRLEYLNWSIDDHDHTVLGAPVFLAGRVIDPSEVFPITDPITGFPADVRVPTLDDVQHDDNNGMLIVYGVPLTIGTFEVDYWKLAPEDYNQFAEDLEFGLVDYIGTTLLEDGQISDIINLYDESFQLTYRTDVWGGGLTMLSLPRNPNNGFRLQGLAGFRVLGYDDQMSQTGVFVGDGANPPLTSVLRAETENRYYGLALGFRAQLVEEWVTLGIEPRVTLAANSSHIRVSTQDFLAVGDDSNSTIDSVDFAPIGEVGVWGQFKLHENVHLRVGYQVLVTTETARSANVIYYNEDPLTPTLSDITAQDERESVLIHGLNLGLTIYFP